MAGAWGGVGGSLRPEAHVASLLLGLPHNMEDRAPGEPKRESQAEAKLPFSTQAGESPGLPLAACPMGLTQIDPESELFPYF